MTFADWYNSTIVPQLNETLKNVPVQARETLRTASRRTMAACWNAALETVCQKKFTREEFPDFPPPCGLPVEIRKQILEMRA
jgi:hypothetical protein